MTRARLTGLATVIATVALLPVGAGSARATTTAPAPHQWYSFAPYVDMSQFPPPPFAKIRNRGGVRDLTLAFVTAQGQTDCVPTWGGFSVYHAYGPHPYQLAEIDTYRSGGGAVIPSFGGETGAELATVCQSAKSLEHAY